MTCNMFRDSKPLFKTTELLSLRKHLLEAKELHVTHHNQSSGAKWNKLHWAIVLLLLSPQSTEKQGTEKD